MSSPPFEKLVVLGLGLLGGSVAAAAKERGLAREVVGAARRSGPLERARKAGIVDSVASPLEAVVGADFRRARNSGRFDAESRCGGGFEPRAGLHRDGRRQRQGFSDRYAPRGSCPKASTSWDLIPWRVAICGVQIMREPISSKARLASSRRAWDRTLPRASV